MDVAPKIEMIFDTKPREDDKRKSYVAYSPYIFHNVGKQFTKVIYSELTQSGILSLSV